MNGWKWVEGFGRIRDEIQGWGGEALWRSYWPPPTSRRLTHLVGGPKPRHHSPSFTRGRCWAGCSTLFSQWFLVLWNSFKNRSLRIHLQTDFGIAALRSSMWL